MAVVIAAANVALKAVWLRARAQRQGRGPVAGRVDPLGDLSRDLVVAAVRHRHEARSSSGSPAASNPCARNRSNSR
ncbi:hypothetical protein [Micromonospora sp. MH33]|uniref:hypothetical protein n=1 Tax=Micromonospora sp. MH33 TaxID=1945509 RepID=UPI0011B2205B|nr:hypothetical protein [Micromonospora sp. MH33]